MSNCPIIHTIFADYRHFSDRRLLGRYVYLPIHSLICTIIAHCCHLTLTCELKCRWSRDVCRWIVRRRLIWWISIVSLTTITTCRRKSDWTAAAAWPSWLHNHYTPLPALPYHFHIIQGLRRVKHLVYDSSTNSSFEVTVHARSKSSPYTV